MDLYNTIKGYSKVALFAMITAGFVAFKATETKVVNEKAVNEVCFEFTEPTSTPGNVVLPGNYTENSNIALLCFEDSELCGVCFDQDEFPLKDGQIDVEDNTELRNLILNNMGDSSNHGDRIYSSEGKWIILYFKPAN